MSYCAHNYACGVRGRLFRARRQVRHAHLFADDASWPATYLCLVPMAAALSDEDLGEVASQIGRLHFRAGVLLGIQPYELDSLQDDGLRQGLNSWQLNMQILQRWRDATSVERERLELARVLKRLGIGRLAVKIEPSVREWKETSFIDPTREELTSQELDEVSKEVTDCWQRLAVCLRVPERVIRDVEARSEEASVQTFRCLWAWKEAGQDVTRKNLAGALENMGKGRFASRLVRK